MAIKASGEKSKRVKMFVLEYFLVICSEDRKKKKKSMKWNDCAVAMTKAQIKRPEILPFEPHVPQAV